MSGTESTSRPSAFQSIKITDTHRAKLAVVYVRQSSPQQVVENRESLARQYSLADYARTLGCTATSVRSAIHAFAMEGLACLKEKSSRPKSARPVLDHVFDEPLRELLHRSPRAFGKHRSTWTLGLVAQVCFEKGWTPRVFSNESIRLAVKRLGVSWRRAKHWIRSPDPAYARKKGGATA